MSFGEEYIRGALARICNTEGATLGTAFFVLAEEGVALTCHHLVENSESAVLDCADGVRRIGIVKPNDRFPEIDLAIVRCIDGPSTALPLVTEYKGIDKFWTNGFHFYGKEITDALPASGNIDGITSITFSTPSRSYPLSGVLVLKHDVIDSGLSGAPVLDPDTGVVFAVVNAKFGRQGPLAGFALPLARAQDHSVELKKLFELNANTIPRYGRFLNHLGAQEICRQQRVAVLDRLIRRDYFLPDLYARRTAQEKFDDFYSSDALIFPLVGNAGVGKTMLLADFARQANGHDSLLLLGRDLSKDESNLPRAITAKLRETCADLLGAHGDASLVANALRAVGRELTVLFDGLNEIPGSAAESLQTWIEHSVNWLEKTNSRLIFSSRPEFWQTSQSLFQDELLFQQHAARDNESPQSGVVLSDFSEEEAAHVRSLYQLPPSISLKHIQHPLMARIYWEMQEGVDGKLEQTTRYQAMQRFIKRKCDVIARAIGHGMLSSHVEVFLSEAAGAAFKKGGFELDNKEFFGLFGGNSLVADQLVNEGLFMSTSAGKRFTFDEIAEFIQSKSLDLAAIIEGFSNEDSTKLTTGGIVYSLLRFEDEDRREDLQKAMDTLISSHSRRRGYLLKSESVIAQALPQLSQPEVFSSQIQTMAKTMAARFERRHDTFGFRAAVARSELPLALKMDILRTFLLLEDSYDFEHHHWHDLQTYVLRHEKHTGAIISELLKATPAEVFAILVEWFNDSSRLRGGNSQLADAAKGLMFHHRHLDLELFCETLAQAGPVRSGVLFYDVVEHGAQEVLAICLRWIKGNDPLLLAAATQLAAIAAGRARDENEQDLVYEILSGTLGRVSADNDVTAKRAIARLHKFRSTVIDEIISLYKQAHPQISGYEIAALADTHFETVVAAVKDVITSSPELASDTLSGLCHQSRTLQEMETLVDLLYLGVENNLAAHSSFRIATENLLRMAQSEELTARLPQLAKNLLSRNADFISNLIYFAAGRYQASEPQNKVRDQLFDLLIEGQADLSDLSRIIDQLATSFSTRPDPLKHLLAVGRKMPVDEFHDSLLSASTLNRPFAKALAAWLESDPRLPPVGLMASFISKVRQGEEADRAARQALEEWWEERRNRTINAG